MRAVDDERPCNRAAKLLRYVAASKATIQQAVAAALERVDNLRALLQNTIRVTRRID